MKLLNIFVFFDAAGISGAGLSKLSEKTEKPNHVERETTQL